MNENKPISRIKIWTLKKANLNKIQMIFDTKKEDVLIELLLGRRLGHFEAAT